MLKKTNTIILGKKVKIRRGKNILLKKNHKIQRKATQSTAAINKQKFYAIYWEFLILKNSEIIIIIYQKIYIY